MDQLTAIKANLKMLLMTVENLGLRKSLRNNSKNIDEIFRLLAELEKNVDEIAKGSKKKSKAR